MSAPTQQAIVDAITALIESGTQPGKFFAELQRRFPGIAESRLDRCIDIAAWELRQRGEEHEREAASLELVAKLFSGMPKVATLLDAAETKAAEGDGVAIALLADFNSDVMRLAKALTKAAAEAHPGWKLISDGSINRTSAQGPDTPDALVDWFQMTHPREASEIEMRVFAGSRR